jgi:hypothetical protein
LLRVTQVAGDQASLLFHYPLIFENRVSGTKIPHSLALSAGDWRVREWRWRKGQWAAYPYFIQELGASTLENSLPTKQSFSLPSPQPLAPAPPLTSPTALY